MFKNSRKDVPEGENARKLLEAKIEDKHQFAVSKNKITNTDFLNLSEKIVAEQFLRERKIKNYLFLGGNGTYSERVILLFYPEKFSLEMVEKNYANILCGIRITLPKDLHYEHRNYLSGILKLGIKREKIGDILVRETGADVIVFKEVSDFLSTNLPSLTRFQKARFDCISMEEIETKEPEFEERTIIVSSMRLDNFVAELARTSRSKAMELINEQRVFVNHQLETKFSKKINLGDIMNIRGKGKFIIEEIDHKTKSEKYVIKIKKYG